MLFEKIEDHNKNRAVKEEKLVKVENVPLKICTNLNLMRFGRRKDPIEWKGENSLKRGGQQHDEI
ncbi:MAG: hypothetical protein PHD67_04730 [Oscillospiraceae bacterium]|nr:hypothetical protein [Oscillospiraceae bacterium]